MRRAPFGALKVGDRFAVMDRCGCVFTVRDEPDPKGMRRYDRFTPCKHHVDDDSGDISADVDVLD